MGGRLARASHRPGRSQSLLATPVGHGSHEQVTRRGRLKFFKPPSRRYVTENGHACSGSRVGERRAFAAIFSPRSNSFVVALATSRLLRAVQVVWSRSGRVWF